MNDRPWLIALVALVLVSNLLLWRVVAQMDDDSELSTARVANNAQLLPAPTPGSSNKATAREVDRLAENLDRNFAALEQKFEEMPDPPAVPNLDAAIEPIRADLQALRAQTASAGAGDSASGVEALLKRLGERMASVASSTSLLQADSAEKLQASNDGIAGTNDAIGSMTEKLTTSNNALGDMTAKMEASNAGIEGTNAKMDAMTAKIAATNVALAELGETMANMDQSLAKMGLMRDDMQELTAKMDALLQVACSVPMLVPPQEACG
jgi:chromosome segregation ATPase